MSDKKIGILSLYYESINCGGLLQAYALCQILKKMGYDAEQICFDDNRKKASSNKKRLFRKLLNPVIVIRHIIGKLKRRTAIFMSKQRIATTRNFREEQIPHSGKIYNNKSIVETNGIYDVFIAGSDQIWNPDWFTPEYMLSFADDGKKKLSYAASMGVSGLNDEERKNFGKYITKIDNISVRESQAKHIIGELTSKLIKVVLDPTLMLDSDDWDKIVVDRIIGREYVFCYFLGKNKEAKKIAFEYAKAKGLKVIIISCLTWDIRFEDYLYSNKRVKGAGPREFISLIKHANAVFTDSFHATVFSCIYSKSFYVFGRSDNDKSGSRLRDIVGIFDCEDRYINTSGRLALEYVLSVKDRDSYDYSRLCSMRKDSIEYLKNALD